MMGHMHAESLTLIFDIHTATLHVPLWEIFCKDCLTDYHSANLESADAN